MFGKRDDSECLALVARVFALSLDIATASVGNGIHLFIVNALSPNRAQCVLASEICAVVSRPIQKVY